VRELNHQGFQIFRPEAVTNQVNNIVAPAITPTDIRCPTRHEDPMHKPIALAALALTLTAAPALAQQSPNTTPTTVTRVVLVRIVPGHGDQFWADIRQHLKPIYDEQKRQGLLTDYSFGTKSTTDSPDDWNVVLTLTYPNWAALDTFQSRSDPITLAHYGSAANRTAANQARIQHGTIVASFLVRNQTVNPWK
jgi:hypothetical protein